MAYLITLYFTKCDIVKLFMWSPIFFLHSHFHLGLFLMFISFFASLTSSLLLSVLLSSSLTIFSFLSCCLSYPLSFTPTSSLSWFLFLSLSYSLFLSSSLSTHSLCSCVITGQLDALNLGQQKQYRRYPHFEWCGTLTGHKQIHLQSIPQSSSALGSCVDSTSHLCFAQKKEHHCCRDEICALVAVIW